MRYDYLAIGHLTSDVMADGSSRAGGTVLYSALQAARFGLRAAILTRGVRAEIEALLGPHADELELIVQSAAQTTTLKTTGAGTERRQRVLAWAGPIEQTEIPDCAIAHLAPVAGELTWDPPTPGAFRGFTAQGALRGWSPPANEIVSIAPQPASTSIAAGCDAVVISAAEREVAGPLLASALAAGGLVAVTAGAEASELHSPAGEWIELAVAPIESPADDLGAGDVFAAALFIALSQGLDVRVAGELANAAAAHRMLGHGPAAIGTRAEIEAGLRGARRTGAAPAG